MRPHHRFVRRGGGAPLRLPRHVATTAHLSALHPWSIDTGLPEIGPILGANRLAGGGFHFDLVDAYAAGLVQGPNMIISGAGAYGKSAIAKSYIYRTSLLSARSRRRTFTAVIDPKGEWAALGERLGYATLRLRPGGNLRVNPLDDTPGVHPARALANGHRTSAGDPGTQAQATRRGAVLAAMLAVALGRPELAAGEQRLLTAIAHRLTSARPTPTLVDVRKALAHPDSTLADDLDTTEAELLDRRRPLLDACATILEQDLHGICDGPTTPDLTWDDAPGMIIDLSGLLTNRRALRLVLTAVAAWLQTVLYGQTGHKTMVIDEGWVALDDHAIVRFLQDQWRLGRQWGAANILVTHAISDLQAQAGAGTATARIAEGLLNTTSVRVFLHQNPEQTGHLLTGLGLTTVETDLLRALPPFVALWDVGGHTALVDHIITADEWSFADTDSAMRPRNAR
ncbi:hypothetical protein [Parafrankia sp. EUN1f]|uniref:hypothetical protein n=1 Tax=Parafrankia sp. EUN1f TaxID=102897 RepID=UPI0001C4711D|nr:hypothetical protein [Parafrankia sp. EUN1f]EFC79899.1 hypothetical protein FrEUN1fDRAFT_6991 [Parafrankia sp. EUN1f]